MTKTRLFILVIAFFSLCTPAHPAEARDLRIGMSQYPSTLNPFFDDMVAKSLVMGATSRPVTAYDANWKLICLICTELPSFENGRAKKEKTKEGGTGIAATYTLKDNLFWGDGKPVVAADIVLAYDIGRHPQSGVSNGEFFSKDIVSLTADDDKNFTIHFAKDKCSFADIASITPVPAHLERAVFEKDPPTYRDRTLYNTDPLNPGLYFGPYKVAKLETGAYIALDKNPYWRGKAPAFDHITFRTIENSAALSAHLLSGDIDYIAGELGLSLDQALGFEKRLDAEKPGQYDVIYKQGLTYEHIDVNLDQKPFDDVRVRQALMFATDREAVNRQLFDGRQPPALSMINPLDPAYTTEVPLYPYDLPRAEKLLDNAGWVKKEDGYRYNAAGARLRMVLSTTAGNKSREMIEQSLQSDWKKAGIETGIENEAARVFFGDTMRERKFRGGTMYAWLSAPGNVPKTTLHSSMIPTKENNYAGQNYTGYKNPKADKIIDDLDIVCAPDKSKALWHDLQSLYAADLPALPLYYRADSFFIPKWLKGVTPTGHLNPSTLWIEDWSVTP